MVTLTRYPKDKENAHLDDIDHAQRTEAVGAAQVDGNRALIAPNRASVSPFSQITDINIYEHIRKRRPVSTTKKRNRGVLFVEVFGGLDRSRGTA